MVITGKKDIMIQQLSIVYYLLIYILNNIYHQHTRRRRERSDHRERALHDTARILWWKWRIESETVLYPSCSSSLLSLYSSTISAPGSASVGLPFTHPSEVKIEERDEGMEGVMDRQTGDGKDSTVCPSPLLSMSLLLPLPTRSLQSLR